jgi:hypothetical protein
VAKWPTIGTHFSADAKVSDFNEWRYTVDREATIAAYAKTERGGADR